MEGRPEDRGEYLFIGVDRVSRRPRWQRLDGGYDGLPKIAFHALFSVQKRQSMDAILC